MDEELNDFNDAINLIRKIADEGFYEVEGNHEEDLEKAYCEILKRCREFLEERGLE